MLRQRSTTNAERTVGESSQHYAVKMISTSSKPGAWPALGRFEICSCAGRPLPRSRLLYFKMPVDQTDADSSFGADVVHARLMKSALGEADDGRLENLGPAIERCRFRDQVRH